ncbi:MAG: hypothetical protein V1837_05630 [Candidatus Woesearchaeota archaeon]
MITPQQKTEMCHFIVGRIKESKLCQIIEMHPDFIIARPKGAQASTLVALHLLPSVYGLQENKELHARLASDGYISGHIIFKEDVKKCARKGDTWKTSDIERMVLSQQRPFNTLVFYQPQTQSSPACLVGYQFSDVNVQESSTRYGDGPYGLNADQLFRVYLDRPAKRFEIDAAQPAKIDVLAKGKGPAIILPATQQEK